MAHLETIPLKKKKPLIPKGKTPAPSKLEGWAIEHGALEKPIYMTPTEAKGFDIDVEPEGLLKISPTPPEIKAPKFEIESIPPTKEIPEYPTPGEAIIGREYEEYLEAEEAYEQQLFKYADIKSAIDRKVDIEEKEPKIMGVDIARFGDDSSVAIIKQGRHKRTLLPRFKNTVGMSILS